MCVLDIIIFQNRLQEKILENKKRVSVTIKNVDGLIIRAKFPRVDCYEHGVDLLYFTALLRFSCFNYTVLYFRLYHFYKLISAGISNDAT